MTGPSQQDLYKRLRELHPDATSDERLARVLDLDSVSTLLRLKRGKGVNFETTVRLIGEAGWLKMDEGSTGRAQLRQVKREMKALAETLQAALERVP